MGYNSCKVAKTYTEQASLLTCQLCVSNTTVADGTYDHTFQLCQHPLVCQARAESDALLLTAPLLNDLDMRLFQVLLRLVQEEDAHRITWGIGTRHRSPNSTTGDPTYRLRVQALSASLLARSKHLVKRIDIIWAANQQGAYHTALSRTPDTDPVLLRTLQRRCSSVILPRPPPPRSSTQSDSAMFPVFTPLG